MQNVIRIKNPATVIARMGEFAQSTKNDKLSNAVARVAERLAHVGAICEAPLTKSEMAIIRPFMQEAN